MRLKPRKSPFCIQIHNFFFFHFNTRVKGNGKTIFFYFDHFYEFVPEITLNKWASIFCIICWRLMRTCTRRRTESRSMWRDPMKHAQNHSASLALSRSFAESLPTLSWSTSLSWRSKSGNSTGEKLLISFWIIYFGLVLIKKLLIALSPFFYFICVCVCACFSCLVAVGWFSSFFFFFHYFSWSHHVVAVFFWS